MSPPVFLSLNDGNACPRLGFTRAKVGVPIEGFESPSPPVPRPPLSPRPAEAPSVSTHPSPVFYGGNGWRR
jgi:hypothetical protein